MPRFTFTRFLRTESSEVHYIHMDRPRSEHGTNPAIGVLHLHIAGKLIQGALLLHEDLSESELEELNQLIEALVGNDESRDDFLFAIYRVEEIANFSDSVDDERRRWEPPLRKDLEELDSSLKRVLGRHQAARGLLSEHALIDFFGKQGYVARKATDEEDHAGIDVVATNAVLAVYAQVKLGQADERDLAKLANAVVAQPALDRRRKVGLLVAQRFPANMEFLRMELEAKFGISLACVHKGQVLDVASTYRHALE